MSGDAAVRADQVSVSFPGVEADERGQQQRCGGRDAKRDTTPGRQRLHTGYSSGRIRLLSSFREFVRQTGIVVG